MPTLNSNLPLIEPGDPIRLVTDFNALATALEDKLKVLTTHGEVDENGVLGYAN